MHLFGFVGQNILMLIVADATSAALRRRRGRIAVDRVWRRRVVLLTVGRIVTDGVNWVRPSTIDIRNHLFVFKDI